MCKNALKRILHYPFGVPPNRIDPLNEIEGVDFEKAWLKKKTERIQIADKLMSLYFLSLEHLIINKEKTGRPKDLGDLDYLKNVE